MKKTISATLIVFTQFICGELRAQLTNDAYRSFIKVAGQCIYYRPERFDTLYRMKIMEIYRNDTMEREELAWIEMEKDSISVLTIDGYEYTLAGEKLLHAETVKPEEYFIKQNSSTRNNDLDFGRNYLIAFWMDKKGRPELAKQMLPQTDTLISPCFVVDAFGKRYYSAMLVSYSQARDYPAAIKYGEVLNRDVFKTYRYQKEALALMRQLKKQTKDFTTFTLPCKQKWACIKKELNRKAQIQYMADRLRLINSIQPGQPANVNYKDPQFPFPISERGDVNYWEYSEQYSVINPYSELLEMKLSPAEVELLLPYLFNESYIPTYSYFRDFMSERTLHKLSWVIIDLLYEITDRRFINQQTFDSLDNKGKAAAVEEIRKWCRESNGQSAEERTNVILNSSSKWSDFAKALETAIDNKYEGLLPALEKRFNDFPGKGWQSHQGVMARIMFEYGNEKYIPTVRQWGAIKGDESVAFWASLFLIRYDKESYGTAMNRLEQLLNEDDGTSYYPHAIDLLLSLNDKKAQQLAEGIMDKEGFRRSILMEGFYLDIIRKLLISKSDYTYNVTVKMLETVVEELEHAGSGQEHQFSMPEFYAASIDNLRNDKHAYYQIADKTKRKAYVVDLLSWFKAQYTLYKDGKKHEMNLTLSGKEEPITFVDSPGRD